MHLQPTLFVSHGAPSFALEPGEIGGKLGQLGRRLPRPKAVAIVSPHWTTHGVRVGAAARPSTIHDFRGFDPALYDIEYPAPGDPKRAARVAEVLEQAGWPAELDHERGLDHGAWVPLLHLFPEADVPVVPVSLPADLDADRAWALGEALAPLREGGVLVVGSGSLTHNLYEVFRGVEDSAYAAEFSAWIRAAIRDGDTERLRMALEIAPQARRAHPTPEHFWPLLVAAAAGRPEPATILDGGMRDRVLSMDAFLFGSIDAAA